MGKGLFISFEGGEGSGKSSQIRLLESKIKNIGIPCTVTREPGGTTPGEAIRKIALDPHTGDLSPWTELLLFNAARSELVHRIIKPALKERHIVLCDRFKDSTNAYQGIARGLGVDKIKGVIDLACEGILPNKTFLLDVDVETGLARAKGRNTVEENNEGRFEQEKVAFHQTIRDGFLSLAKQEPERFVVIDSTTQSIEEISGLIWQSVEPLLIQKGLLQTITK